MNIDQRLRIMNLPIIGKYLFYRCFVKREGGELTSTTLREMILHKYYVDVGLHTYGGCFQPDFNYQLGGKVKIGRYCSIAGGVHYYGANHPIDRAIMSPYYYNSKLGFAVTDVHRNELIIGNDVWCGGNVSITSGCKHIGNGAVIGAGSVLTKDVPAYAVVAGNPGKIIKYRFSESEQRLLEDSQWWLKDPQELFLYYDLMSDPVKFCKCIREQANT